MSIPTTPLLRVDHLKISFPGPPVFEAVRDISFSLTAGKTLALVGQSGSGKSVTSLALMGLLPETARLSGKIDLAGEVHRFGTDNRWFSTIRGKKIGMVFQEPMSALNPVMKCGKQLMESILVHQNISRSDARKQAVNWMNRVKLPNCEQLFHRYPHQLSGGQKQRMMIAMAICNHPKLLIADEPTTALDVTVQAEIISLLQQLQHDFGLAILFITHDLALARTIADDYLILEKGEVVHTDLDFHLPGIKLSADSNHTEPLLQVENLEVIYQGQGGLWNSGSDLVKAVDRVSFSIFPGETLGLVGESGCGKSTLSRTLMGLQSATSGSIVFKGESVTSLRPVRWRALRKKIQIIFQDPYASLNPRIKVGDALKEPIVVHHERIKGRSLDAAVAELLSLVQLPVNAKDKYPHEFSGGQRQRICIARALALRPELIICDESVSALDVKIQGQILELLAQLQEEKNLTYLFITHDLHVVQSVSDRILVMQNGKIVEQGPTAQVMRHPQQAYTRRLIAAMPHAD